MGYGTNGMTTVTGAKFLPEKWAKDAEIAREQNLVMASKVKRYDTDVADSGSKVHIPFVSNLVTTAVADNTAVTFQAPTETEVVLNLNRQYESSFNIGDKLSAQTAYDLGKLYSEKIGYALAEKIETDLTSLYSVMSQSTGDGTAEITEANIARALLYLDNAKVPQTDRHFVVRPSVMYSLRQIADFTEYQMTGKDGVQAGGSNGMVMNAYGLDITMTTTIVSTSNHAQNLLFHRNAFALAIQKDVSVEQQRRADFLATGYVASALWGYTELRDDHGVVLITKDNIA